MPPEMRPVVRLAIVTRGEPVVRSVEQDKIDEVVAQARVVCPACEGDAERCLAGAGPPTFRRLTGCRAYTDGGRVKALTAPPAPRQPWDVRPSRAARAA